MIIYGGLSWRKIHSFRSGISARDKAILSAVAEEQEQTLSEFVMDHLYGYLESFHFCDECGGLTDSYYSDPDEEIAQSDGEELCRSCAESRGLDTKRVDLAREKIANACDENDREEANRLIEQFRMSDFRKGAV